VLIDEEDPHWFFIIGSSYWVGVGLVMGLKGCQQHSYLFIHHPVGVA